MSVSAMGPCARTRPAGEEQGVVGALRGDVELVRREEDGAAPFGASPHRVEDEEAVSRIEVRGRLVEEEDRGLAREDSREKDALPLAAATSRGCRCRRASGASISASAASRRPVAAPRARRTPVRTACAPGGRDRARASGRAARSPAGDSRSRAPPRAGGCPTGGARRGRTIPRRAGTMPASAFRSVDFPAPFSPSRTETRPASNVQRDVRKDVARAVARGERLGGERRGHGRALRRTRNAGAPRRAVTAPTEISAGAKSERAAHPTRRGARRLRERREGAARGASA